VIAGVTPLSFKVLALSLTDVCCSVMLASCFSDCVDVML
jgi:hypothetical protein